MPANTLPDFDWLGLDGVFMIIFFLQIYGQNQLGKIEIG
jgi:hypothetical protein